MLLLIAFIASVLSSLVYFANTKAKRQQYHLGALSVIFLSATLMWSVDAVVLVVEEGWRALFFPDVASVVDDVLLGANVILLALLVWFGVNLKARLVALKAEKLR